jgi:hypothetical protein
MENVRYEGYWSEKILDCLFGEFVAFIMEMYL